ncbi:hypothetical protein FRB95_003053 [Tulasnella sp. JGI-2019a]|nr:hypothetical protein FRB93_005501 [Tulasnella sp. JGI-2019a]KAG9031214.1 hypothetical protein FRB95_003053 [Tulasnella sp. JGI-2019a]
MANSGLAASYKELKAAFESRTLNLQKSGALLSKLKIGLLEAGLLFPQDTVNKDDLLVTRDILEMGALWSIRTKDVPSFDRYYSQLETFYVDYSSVLPLSLRQYCIQGLNLIRLLTQNRIADFHTKLESLPADALQDNKYIKHPVNLERWLMEGSYSKVWVAREEAPAEEYKFFVDSLMGTIRNEIASCEEAAYESLPFRDAAALLFFTKNTDLVQFAQNRGWQINPSTETIGFAKKGEEKIEIPKEKMIVAALHYARELEQIV